MIPLLLAISLITTPDTLTWNDFKGNPTGESNVLALTWWKIDLNIQEENGKCTYEVVASIDKERSFTRTSDLDILAHEKGHFDLARIYARRIQKLIAKYQGTGPMKTKIVNRIYDDMCFNLRMKQAEYDLRTDHARSEKMQAKWNEQIKRMLNELAE